MSDWTRCDERLPELDVLVWLADDESIWLGCRADDVDGWLWARVYESPTWSKHGWYVADMEADDDYQPTHWAPMPVPPKQEVDRAD